MNQSMVQMTHGIQNKLMLRLVNQERYFLTVIVIVENISDGDGDGYGEYFFLRR